MLSPVFGLFVVLSVFFSISTSSYTAANSENLSFVKHIPSSVCLASKTSASPSWFLITFQILSYPSANFGSPFGVGIVTLTGVESSDISPPYRHLYKQ